MPTTYKRAANPIWNFWNQLGQFAIDAEMTTYRSVSKQDKKATYSDPAGINANPNPIRLNELGSPQGNAEIYWADDEKYYVEIVCNDGTKYSFDNFPDSGAGGGSTTIGLYPANQLPDGPFLN